MTEEPESRYRLGAFANAVRMFTKRVMTESDNHSTDTTLKTAEVEVQRELSPPPLPPIRLQGYLESTKKHTMSSNLAEEIRGLLPMRLQLHDEWNLAYSLEQHGTSLHTLYDKCVPERGKRPGYVLAITDHNGYVFGAYVNEYFHVTDGKRFYGNGESFLWKTRPLDDGELRFQAFPYTGLNDFVIYCTSSFLSMGGGDGHYGIWIDDDLDKGVSSRSLTFGNEPLSESGTKFRIISLEVWRVGS